MSSSGLYKHVFLCAHNTNTYKCTPAVYQNAIYPFGTLTNPLKQVTLYDCVCFYSS